MNIIPELRESDADKYLYHYCSFESSVQILATKQILFSSQFNSIKANDPMECKPNIFQYFMWLLEQVEDDVFVSVPHCYLEIMEQTKIICFAQDTNSNGQNLIVNNKEFLNLSIRRGYSYPRMWAQYAHNHYGVCFIFDKKQLIKDFRMCFTQAQIYAIDDNLKYIDRGYGIYSVDHIDRLELNKKKQRRLKEIHASKKLSDYEKQKAFLELFAHDIYFTKDINWSEEHEYRLMIFDSSSIANSAHFLPIINSLQGIICGCRTSKSIFDTLRAIDQNIEICRIDYNMQALTSQ